MDDLTTRLQVLLGPYLTPDLLHPSYRATWSPDNPWHGLCSVASEAAWFVLGGAPNGWVAQVGRDDLGGTHWWLEGPDQERVDLTADQYTSQGRPLPYAAGRPGGFMGIRRDPGNPWGLDRRPSQRAAQVLDAVVAQWGSVEQVRQALHAPRSRPKLR